MVITGLGSVSSLGRDVPTLWKSILEGRSGVSWIEQYPSEHFPVRVGSEVDLDALGEAGLANEPLSRAARFGLAAFDQAWQQAGFVRTPPDPWRTGVCVGASTFPVFETHEIAHPARLFGKGGTPGGNGLDAEHYLALCRARPELLRQRNIAWLSTILAQRQNLRGPSLTVQTACASATQALGEAFRRIRDGQTDVMISGGTDSMIGILCLVGFTLLGTLASAPNGDPSKASRPFDARRTGFVIGEGAGLLVLEERQHALDRGAEILGELIGYGTSSDGYRFTDVHPEGAGAIACMRSALDDARLALEEVDYINAHGTATELNDPVETRAIRSVFGLHADRLAVSSSKSQLGHLICAAGGIEAILTVLALREGWLPPTINLDHPDPACDLDYVPHEARQRSIGVALSNSFGFGGHNGTLVMRRSEAA